MALQPTENIITEKFLGGGDAFDLGALQLAAVFDRDERDCRTRRLRPGRQGQSGGHEDQEVQVTFLNDIFILCKLVDSSLCHI